MPEENSSSSSTATTPIKTSPRKPNPILIILGIVFVVLLFSLGYYYLNYTAKNDAGTEASAGLEKDQVRLGWTSLSGVYPRNSSPPTVDDNNFNEAVFEALTKVRGSSIVPSLATKWTNPNENTWRVDIRKNVAFHSGDLLTAEDVKYSFDQVIASSEDEDNSWPSVNSIATIKSVKVVDEDTVDIETTQPDPILLSRITDVFILSKKQVEKDTLDKAVGTGPFKVVSYEKDKMAVVQRNSGYWGTKPKLAEATFVIYDDDDALLAALKKGEIDYARVGLADVAAPSGFQIVKKDQPRVIMLFFNFAAKKVLGADNPLLNKKVREAVKLSIDQNKLIKDSAVSGTSANQFLTQSIVGYNNTITTTNKNVAKAKSLLSEEKVTNLTFAIHATPDRESVAKAVATELKDSGIVASVVVEQNFGALVEKLFSGEITAFIAGPLANDGGEYIGSVFKTEAEQNILSYSNSTVDKAIVEANKSFSPRERRKLLEDISSVIINDVPVVPLYSVTDSFVVKEDIDFEVNSLADFVLESVAGKELKSNNSK